MLQKKYNAPNAVGQVSYPNMRITTEDAVLSAAEVGRLFDKGDEMKAVLTRKERAIYWRDRDDIRHDGVPPGVYGDYSSAYGNFTGVSGDLTGVSGDLTHVDGDFTNKSGNFTGVYGNVSNLRGKFVGVCGDVTNAKGDVTGVSGDFSDVRGNIDEAELTEADREVGVTVEQLIKIESVLCIQNAVEPELWSNTFTFHD